MRDIAMKFAFTLSSFCFALTMHAATVTVRVTFASIPSGKVAPPRIMMGDRKPVEPLSMMKAGETATVTFRDVPDGPATITLTGDRWKTVESKIDVKGD